MKACARANRSCRLRESSCSRLMPSETVAHAAGRHAAGPSWLGWVPSGSRLGRARPRRAGGTRCSSFNFHVRYTRATSPSRVAGFRYDLYDVNQSDGRFWHALKARERRPEAPRSMEELSIRYVELSRTSLDLIHTYGTHVNMSIFFSRTVRR